MKTNLFLSLTTLFLATSIQAAEYSPEKLCAFLKEFAQAAREAKDTHAPPSNLKSSYDQFRDKNSKERLEGLAKIYDKIVDESYASNASLKDLQTKIYTECISKKYTQHQLITGDGIQ